MSVQIVIMLKFKRVIISSCLLAVQVRCLLTGESLPSAQSSFSRTFNTLPQAHSKMAELAQLHEERARRHSDKERGNKEGKMINLGDDYPDEKTSGIEIIDVNLLHGGPYDSQREWNADCNDRQDMQMWLVGIWDDDDSFEDVDTIKCRVPKIVKLNMSQHSVADLGLTGRNCGHHESLTAVWDDSSGFYNAQKIKCTKMIGEEWDFETLKKMSTEGKSGGPESPLQTWKVECPVDYVPVGLFKNPKKLGQILSLNCAKLTHKSK